MRYFIYKDSQISGPFSREELAQVSGLRPETLVCEEGISGGHDGDWKTIGQVSELADLDGSSPVSLVQRQPWEGDVVEAGPGDRNLPTGFGETDSREWETPWAKEDPAALFQAEGKIQELNHQLETLRSRFAEWEKKTNSAETQRISVPAPKSVDETKQALMLALSAEGKARELSRQMHLLSEKYERLLNRWENAELQRERESYSHKSGTDLNRVEDKVRELTSQMEKLSGRWVELQQKSGQASDKISQPKEQDKFSALAETMETLLERFAEWESRLETAEKKRADGELASAAAAPEPAAETVPVEEMEPAEAPEVEPAAEPAPGPQEPDSPQASQPEKAASTESWWTDSERNQPNKTAHIKLEPLNLKPPAKNKIKLKPPKTLRVIIKEPAAREEPAKEEPPVIKDEPPFNTERITQPIGQTEPAPQPSLEPSPTAGISLTPLPALFQPTAQAAPLPAEEPSPSREPGNTSPIPDFEQTPSSAMVEPTPTPTPFLSGQSAPGFGMVPNALNEPSSLPLLAPLPSEQESFGGAPFGVDPAFKPGALGAVAKKKPGLAGEGSGGPAKASRAPRPAPRPFPKVLVGGMVGMLILIIFGFIFFGNSKSRKMPAANPEKLSFEAAQPAPAAEASGTQQTAAVPAAAPAAAPPVPGYEGGDFALRLVKNYPLDGNRGTVEKWLQYSFMANPGSGNREEWTSGAVDATTYLVQYRVLPGPRSGVKETITYLFEADVSRRTVKGSNPSSRQLMAGASPPAPVSGERKKKDLKTGGKSKVSKIPQLPLPGYTQRQPLKKQKIKPKPAAGIDL